MQYWFFSEDGDKVLTADVKDADCAVLYKGLVEKGDIATPVAVYGFGTLFVGRQQLQVNGINNALVALNRLIDWSQTAVA